MRPHIPAAAVVVALIACSHAAPVTQSARPATATTTAPASYGAPFKARPLGTGAIKVGPPRGTVVVMGGGGMGPEIYKAFIDAAGGPDALILDVPNAGGADSVNANAGQGWRNNGAK